MIQNIELHRITPNPQNPRRTRSQESLQELADSILAQGLLQPITVRIHPESNLGAKKPNYQIVMGERRYLACKLASLDTIDCIVRDMTDREVAEAMLVENLQRADVDPIEEAVYVDSALSQGMTPAEVGARLGKSAKWVAIRIQIASMAEEILALLKDGKIGVAHVQMLAQVKDPEVRLQLANEAADNNWTLAELRVGIDEHQRKLEDAPWKMNAKLDGCPTCVGCQDRSDKQGDLFGGEKHALCLNGECWKQKLEAHKTALKSKLEADGRTVLNTNERWSAENGYSGYTKDESKIKELQSQGVKARVLIGEDGNTAEYWNTNDAPDTEEEETAEDPEAVKARDEKQREYQIGRIDRQIRDELVAKKLENPDETIFFDFLADAIIEESYSEELQEMREKIGDNEFNPIRQSKVGTVKLKELRKAICNWIVDSIEITDEDLKTFRISPTKIRKQAEAKYEEEKAKEEEEQDGEE